MLCMLLVYYAILLLAGCGVSTCMVWGTGDACGYYTIKLVRGLHNIDPVIIITFTYCFVTHAHAEVKMVHVVLW